ncbi:MAG: RAMP superfamily CRISPR-associated protein [Fischerella sp. CENA71]|nr:RAMP superfamily CRISPR-associated protein [Fischerella sp. CENA71]
MIEMRHISNRNIIKRIIVRGKLILNTPTCLGSGDADSPLDLALLRDSTSNHALLTGSSIAGALRNYLREYDRGYSVKENRNEITTKLFGDLFAYKNEEKLSENEKIQLREKDNQSLLIIDDAVSTTAIQAEIRDGVKIDSVTNTAANKAKYDLEVLEAGTEFNLNFELLIETDEHTLIKALAIALQGLETGQINLGIKKHRGFGRCHVEKWQVWQFDLREYEQRIQWLNFPHWESGFLNDTHDNIADALGVSLDWEDKRQHITITAIFTLASPLLIRSAQASTDKAPDVVNENEGIISEKKTKTAQASTDKAPDVVHLKSRRNGNLKSILSGTSLTGVLRHRAERIINTIGVNINIVNDIFGFVDENTKKAKASRLIVDEVEINNTTDLVQNRIAIDRFTGGALHGALFNEQPVFGNDETSLVITLELRQPKHYEIGLLLLLLKDLWTGDLPVGGTSSIGRGRLQGKHATIEFDKKTWVIEQKSVNEPLLIDNAEDLETFVAALHQEVTT